MTTTKNCPYCDELISINAIKCKHCGSMLSDFPTPSGNMDPFTFTKTSLSGRYEILNEIGRGGMATVYKAIQKNLQRTVALKVIHQNLIHDKEFLERFHSEARLAASLNHPNIVAIYDEGIENGVHFIAMEYLDGEDLHQKVKTKGKLSIEQTVQIISSIAESLDHIHKKGLIHRDIKTSNIIITKTGRAVLTDFGIARAISGSKLSQTGSVLGTPEYMSPEQADGIGAEPRSDLYSLGVVLYECLTGVLPFSGENPVATIYKIINSPHPPLTRFNGSVPTWLQSITDKSLSKNPHNRFASGEEFSTALREKKIVAVMQEHFPSPKTKKLDSKDFKIEFSHKENAKQISKQKIKPNKIRSKRKSNPSPVFLIGGVIVILLIIIAVILLKDFNFGTRNTEGLVKDAQWSTLSEVNKKQVLSLIELGDNFFENKHLLQPVGNNAYEKYKEVLKIHPTNNYASVQLEKIFNETFKKAGNDLSNGNTEEANSLITQIRQLYPEKEPQIISLFQTNQVSVKLSECKRLLAKNDLSLDGLSQVYANVSTVLSLEPDNERAKEYLDMLKSRYSQLGEAYYSSNQFQRALEVYQQAKDYFVDNEVFVNRINDCRRRIEAESLVSVPALMGVAVDVARSIATHQGFTISAVISRAGLQNERGLVVAQSPVNGTRVRRGSSIILTVGE
jgi:serine/threonine protein kinase